MTCICISPTPWTNSTNCMNRQLKAIGCVVLSLFITCESIHCGNSFIKINGGIPHYRTTLDTEYHFLFFIKCSFDKITLFHKEKLLHGVRKNCPLIEILLKSKLKDFFRTPCIVKIWFMILHFARSIGYFFHLVLSTLSTAWK